MRKIQILDSTLRDGAQSDGISFSLNDKINIIKSLDDMGIDFIECGNPASNPKDRELFDYINKTGFQLKNSKLTAFGSTRRKNTLVSEDPGCKALLAAGTPVVSIFGKSSLFHVKKILHTSDEENLKIIETTCRFFKDHGKMVIYDAEQFFDGYLHDPEYAVKTLLAAKNGGASSITLCDTNGGTLPDQIYSICSGVLPYLEGTPFGIHTHNDCGLAIANSIMAVDAGASQVQGTFVGFGERTGNANLSAIIPILQIKRGYMCIPPGSMENLTSTARKIAEISNVSLDRNMPFVGRNAFAHKAGMHADGVLKDRSAFEHIPPSSIGNKRRILVSEMAGKSSVLHKVRKIYPDLSKDSPVLDQIVTKLKEKEQLGYQYEGAEGSFELLVRKAVEGPAPSFKLLDYIVVDELSSNDKSTSTAIVKLSINDVANISIAKGDGPVNSLDNSLRKALSDFYPCLSTVRLIDYKVRVTDSGSSTAAVVRVFITSTDGDDVWTTVGISHDIIKASWFALADSVEYKLLSSH
ncbi:MAG: citramalate synthase [Oscillospiraceae bacterium]|jgi:2-isopropylmalate synthase|nr:citramalate synthase [Oscillospiraceae bacterium]